MACKCLISTRLSADGDDGNVDYCDYDLNGDLADDESKRAVYLKSMFMCVTPEPLSLLAIMMYQKFEGMCPNYIQEAKKYDEKKVYNLIIYMHACMLACIQQFCINPLFFLQVLMQLRSNQEQISVRYCS